MSAPHANTWDEVPPDVQHKVHDLYRALIHAAMQVDASPEPAQGNHKYAQGLVLWEYLPDRMKTAIANTLMAQRHEIVRALTAVHQSILGDVVHRRH